MRSSSEATVASPFRLATEEQLTEMLRLLSTRKYVPDDLTYFIGWANGNGSASAAQIIKWMRETVEAL